MSRTVPRAPSTVREALVKAVDDENIDLVVVGSRGLTGLRRALLSSVRCVRD